MALSVRRFLDFHSWEKVTDVPEDAILALVEAARALGQQ
jgi:hypothetical protein